MPKIIWSIASMGRKHFIMRKRTGPKDRYEIIATVGSEDVAQYVVDTLNANSDTAEAEMKNKALLSQIDTQTSNADRLRTTIDDQRIKISSLLTELAAEKCKVMNLSKLKPGEKEKS